MIPPCSSGGNLWPGHRIQERELETMAQQPTKAMR